MSSLVLYCYQGDTERINTVFFVSESTYKQLALGSSCGWVYRCR